MTIKHRLEKLEKRDGGMRIAMLSLAFDTPDGERSDDCTRVTFERRLEGELLDGSKIYRRMPKETMADFATRAEWQFKNEDFPALPQGAICLRAGSEQL